ncbi:MAG: phosphoesterase, partial [Cutibacterium sp.]|nr:phosphoesterase [Cutibacterium sp.]
MRTTHHRITAAGAAVTAGLMAFSLVTPASAAQTPSPTKPAPAATPAAASTTGHKRITTTGLKPGDVKHVWLIILENKSYDATFTGLNQNSYLWKTLPSQGALLTHYYGTGHYSQDNYTSLVSGQATSFDLQADCDISNTDLGSNESIITKHKGKPFGPDDNYGQVMSLAGPNAPDGENGCTYPRKTPTLFNQFDAAGVTWKGYAQDLHAQAGREDALGGAPGSRENDPSHNPKSMKPSDDDKAKGISSFTGAQENDQYVAKHFPFPWFHS